MLLAIDSGNSFVKFGVYDKEKLVTFGKLPVEELVFRSFKNYDIKDVAISSVVPNRIKKLSESVNKEFSIEPFIIDIDKKFNLKIEYRTKDTLGIDRICGAEGAYALLKKDKDFTTNEFPVVTVDFGTATTINLIKPGGIFAGGIITPGIETMINSLFNKTAQLPYIDLNEYHEFIGKDTISCIASGIMNTTVGLIEKAVDRITTDYGSKPTVYLTGGNATLLKPYLHFECTIVNDLVLKGVNSLFMLNNMNNNDKDL